VNVHAPEGEDLVRLLDRTGEAGIGSIRIDLVWALVELEPGVDDWSRYDALVDTARARGLEILAILAYTPAWATDGPELSGVPREPWRWADFCRRAVTRYRGRIRAWEVWNEPNLERFWAGSREQYLEEILVPGVEAVRAADPDALATGPGLALTGANMLDGRSINGAHWVYFGALSDVEYLVTVRDRSQGSVRTYRNPAGILCGQADVGAFASNAEAGEPVQELGLAPTGGGANDRVRLGAPSTLGCTAGASATEACLHGDRFRVAVEWRDPKTGLRHAAAALAARGPEDDTGLFWFFDRENLELAVKVLDGRGVNGRFWVYAGALSDVEYWTRVTDTSTGGVREYHNPPGTLCGMADVEAF
jgi:hypothetical protein